MTYAAINGWALEAAGGDQGRRTVEDHGVAGKSFLNRPRVVRSGVVKSWDVPVICQTPADADTLEGLLGGRCFTIPCDDDAWSAGTGIGPEKGSLYTVEHNGPGDARFGRGFLDVTSATWNAKLPSGKWAIAYWRGGPGAWEHVIVRSDGAKWLDGVTSATATPELTVAPPLFGFDAVEIDDVVGYSFFPSDSWLEASAAWTIAGKPFSHLPRLELSGDIVGAGCETTVEGRPVTNQDYVSAHFDGAWESDRRDLALVFDALEANTVRRIWRPAFAWRLDDGYLVSGGGVYHPAAGTARGTIVGGSVVGGPFGFGGARNYTGAGTNRVDVGAEANRGLDGLSRFSVAAWVRRDSIGTQHALLSFETPAAGANRLVLDILSDNSVRVFLRDGGAGSPGRAFSAGVLTDLDEFHLVGADVDLIDDVARIFIDGVEIGSGALGVAFSTMQDTAGSINRLALNVSGVVPLDGDLAWAGLFIDRLPAYAWSEIYRLGKRGSFI